MIEIKEVFTKKEMKDFVKFPFELYKDNKNWVPPLIQEELETFDKPKIPYFKPQIHIFIWLIKTIKL